MNDKPSGFDLSPTDNTDKKDFYTSRPYLLITPCSLPLNLQPLLDAEIEEDEDYGENHQADCEWITIRP